MAFPTVTQRGRYQTRDGYAVQLLRHFTESGVPDVVTADEAFRIASAFGVTFGKEGDYSTPVNRSTLAKRVAYKQPMR